MDRATLAARARKHWKEFLPARYKELQEEGLLNETVQAAAKAAQDLIEDLMRNQGYQAHEAEEVALRQFILLSPEPEQDDDWEAMERAEAERKYQEMMREPARKNG